MREGGQDIWWRRTGQHAAWTLALCLAIGVLPALLSGAFGATVLLGMPLGTFLFVLAAPLAILVATFWFARRQQSYDDRYDVTGD